MGDVRRHRDNMLGGVGMSHRGIAVLAGLAVHSAAIVALVFYVGSINGRVDRVEAARVATIQANYAACIRSIPVLSKFNKVVINAENVANILLVNSIANHQVTKPGTPMWRTQIRNIRRLDQGIRAGSGLRLPVPTRSDCKTRRARALEG